MKGNFRARRYALGLSQKALAEKAGVSQPNLSKMERGVHKEEGNQSSWKVEEALRRYEDKWGSRTPDDPKVEDIINERDWHIERAKSWEDDRNRYMDKYHQQLEKANNLLRTLSIVRNELTELMEDIASIVEALEPNQNEES